MLPTGIDAQSKLGRLTRPPTIPAPGCRESGHNHLFFFFFFVLFYLLERLNPQQIR